MRIENQGILLLGAKNGPDVLIKVVRRINSILVPQQEKVVRLGSIQTVVIDVLTAVVVMRVTVIMVVRVVMKDVVIALATVYNHIVGVEGKAAVEDLGMVRGEVRRDERGLP